MAYSIWTLAITRTILFIAICLSTSTVWSLTCSAEEHNFNNQRCCIKCHPGTGVTSACSLSSDTTCEACTRGSTFSDRMSHQDVCRPCSKCVAHAHVVRTCNLTADTQCACDQEYFLNATDGTCSACAHCEPGFGAYSACAGRQNTECRQCPNGTYSDRSSVEGCRVCRKCGKSQILLQPCSTTQNTICIDLPDGMTSLTGLSVTSRESGDVGGQQSDGGYRNTASELIPLYVAVMGAVIIAVIVYVVVKHYRRRELNKARKNSLTPDPEAPPTQGSSDSGVIIEHNGKGEVTASTFVRDLPAVKRRILEKELDTSIEADNGWAGLAKQLGYNTSRIASLEVRAGQDEHTPIRYLLLEWGKSDTATVGVLIRALQDIGRDDVIRVLNGNSDSFTAGDKEAV